MTRKNLTYTNADPESHEVMFKILDDIAAYKALRLKLEQRGVTGLDTDDPVWHPLEDKTMELGNE